ncbi:MAG: hypothetical protein JNJ85_17150 [Candidatus Kapabacteria bacterium]|nr:hypothetical protein [Candidatus Kapabacteria bacterium]
MPTHKKNTLLQAATSNAETKACKRVFFSPTQENFFPSLPFLIKLFSQRTSIVRNRTETALNVNRFEQPVCGLQTTHHRTDSKPAHNIRLNVAKRMSTAKSKNIMNQLKRRALFGNQSVVLLSTFIGKRTVVHLIPH